METENKYLLGSIETLTRDKSNGSINNSNDLDLGPRSVKEDVSLEGTSYHRIETTLHCCSCLEIYIHKLWFKILIFILVLVLDVSDVITDWSLFIDVLHIEPGLVFGPPEISIVYGLLFFSIIGVMTFSSEIFNVWLEIFLDAPLVNPEFLTICTIWLEDVPQVILSILLSRCREEAVSYFQIVKACLVIFGSFLRVFMGVIRFVDRRSHCNEPRVCLKSLVCGVITTLGLLVLFFSSITIFVLTLHERTTNGEIKLVEPAGFFHGEYDREKYFDNVSIFINLPSSANTNDTIFDNTNWIRLDSIWDIKHSGNANFTLSLDNMTQNKLVLTDRNKTICFNVNRENKTISNGPDNCEGFLSPNSTNTYIMTFLYIPEKFPELLFGDIQYNMRFKNQDGCHNLTGQPLSEMGKETGINKDYPTIKFEYFKTRPNVTDEDHFVLGQDGNLQFYQGDKDLIEIKEVWKTGFSMCESTGSSAPHQNELISVDCD